MRNLNLGDLNLVGLGDLNLVALYRGLVILISLLK